METLKLGQKLTTREPEVLLDPDLKPGKYRVQLAIETARGTSEPAQIVLVVSERRIPTGPLTPAGPLVAGVAVPADIAAMATTAPTKTTTKAPTKAKAKAKTTNKIKPAAKPKPPAKPKRK